jgi:acetoin:2,6-dichlorophenolindophenol oxidoreductase subunit alpha
VVVAKRPGARPAPRPRAGDGPTVLEAKTYRHFGHSRTDPASYRPDEEVRQWLSRDPLDIARARLEALGVPAELVAAVDERVARGVEEAVAAAKAAPGPDPGAALTDVWADGGSAWRT